MLALQPPGRLELSGGVVDPGRPGSASREPRRPVRRAAPELDDVEARDVGQHPELPLWDLPDAPHGVVHRPLEFAVRGELAGQAVPDLAVDAGVAGEAVGSAAAPAAPAPGGDQRVALGDEQAHQVVAGVAAQRHRDPVALVEVVAGDDRLVRLPQLLGVVGVALHAHPQGLVRQRRQGEHLAPDLEDGRARVEGEGLLGADPAEAPVVQLLRAHPTGVPSRREAARGASRRPGRGRRWPCGPRRTSRARRRCAPSSRRGRR